jgi:bifunctional DNA-binding transcriptional regulator/antitoxin component of YhaV-PrlF toxin-antitoxin module
MKKFIRKLTKTSKYSYYVTIPKEILDKYGWREHQRLTVEDKGRGVVEIKDYRNS